VKKKLTRQVRKDKAPLPLLERWVDESYGAIAQKLVATL
jgi:hypothetical protein